jgi:ribosome-binding protein aMBF1 (putative translation factor)
MGNIEKLIKPTIRGTIFSMNDVQELIHQLRAKGWTKASIADELGIPAYTLERWERGIHYPSNAVSVKGMLSRLLGRKRVPKRKRYKRNPPAT